VVDFFLVVLSVSSPAPASEAGANRVAELKTREVIGLPKKTALLLREWRMKSTDGWWGIPVQAAALAAALLAAGVAEAGERLNNDALTHTFRGATIMGFYPDSTLFTETYSGDGSVKYFDRDGTAHGTWSIRDDHFCTFYKEMDGSCFVVEHDGANCFTFYSVDPATNKIDPEDWSARAWDPENGKNTCPTPGASA
jgi:hypothetical protein